MKENHSNHEIVTDTYKCTVPLIRTSKLTSRELGGIGKDLSEGWCLNFAVGCTHGCPFCYVDSIHRRFGPIRYGDIVRRKWGSYLLTPKNIEEAIESTPWERWRGKEVMLSSTHDPYIPELRGITRKILEKALPVGVRFCIQTRSFNVTRDFELLSQHNHQIRIQASIATMNKQLSRAIEPRVPSPEKRLQALRMAKDLGITVGVIVAPVLPPLSFRPDVRSDLKAIAHSLGEVGVDLVFGESLHSRGNNLVSVEEAIGEPILTPANFDELVASVFRGEMARVGARATWWPERNHCLRNLDHSTDARPRISSVNTGQSTGGFGAWRNSMKTTAIGSRRT